MVSRCGPPTISCLKSRISTLAGGCDHGTSGDSLALPRIGWFLSGISNLTRLLGVAHGPASYRQHCDGRRQECGDDEACLARELCNDDDSGEWRGIPGAEHGRSAHQDIECQFLGVSHVGKDASNDRPLLQ